ncbi:hypothetical protein [Nocardia sp. CC227C]|uniref:hypothetical protein n=1 Tax=Nocardia sp. CC227C TaxID=3044562 RepID=UPI00278BFC75|nr:hypothetical protein [Nocardia sp. CC227C]
MTHSHTQFQFPDQGACYPFQPDCPTDTAPPAPAGPAPAAETGSPDPGPLFGEGPTDAFFGGMLPIPEWSWVEVGQGLTVGGAALALTVVLAAVLSALAWLLGWQPARLRNWATAALAVLPGAHIVTNGLDAAAPIREFTSGATMFLDGRYGYGLAVMGVLVVPAAWMFATVMFTSRMVRLATNGFPDPARTERAMWVYAQRQQRAAKRLARYRLPFTTGGVSPDIVFGRLAREETAAPPRSRLQALFARTETRLIIPWIKLRLHMVLVANTGAGKSTLILRLLLSWFVTAWMRHRTSWWRLAKVGRPLALVIDCNGGPDSEATAKRVKTWMRALGVPEQRIGIFSPNSRAKDFESVRLNLWGADNADDMRAVLTAMISGGSTPTTDTEKYFYEIRAGLIHLIVDAPERVETVNGVRTPQGWNPPRDHIEFLRRMDPVVLSTLWGGVFDPDPQTAGPWDGVPGVDLEIQATRNGKQPVLDSARMEFGNLFRTLGDAFDGDAQITDFDVLYCILDGSSQPDRARAQFAALGCMLEQLADQDHGREALLCVDEFSAVSDGKTRAPAWVMRMRKARIGTLWTAQEWRGLGADDDQRSSLVAAAAGGALLGRSELCEELCKAFGTTRRFDLSRKLIGGTRHGDEGNIQPNDQFLVSPTQLRVFGPGDVVHVSGGRARRGHAAPLNDAQLKTLRPLPGLSRLAAPADTDPSPPLAPVIDLSRKRPGHGH